MKFQNFRYITDDLRITIVYRARCFETEKKRDQFNSWYKTGKNVRPVEKILDDLKAELVRKKGYEMKKLNAMNRIDLATVIVDEFIKYPWPTKSLFPYNYCALSKLHPWTAKYLNWICY